MVKQTKTKCDKCASGTKKEHTFIHHFGKTYNLCHVCYTLFKNLGNASLLPIFLENNASDNKDLYFSDVERNILKAREKRKSS